MKILYVVHAYPWVDFSGAPLVAGKYALAALHAGHDVAILTPKIPMNELPPPSGSEYEQIKQLNWHSIPNWTTQAFTHSQFNMPGEPWKFPDFVPDLVHVIDWVGIAPSLFKTLKSIPVPVIRHICNFEDVCHFIEPVHRYASGQPCKPPLSAENCAACVTNKFQLTLGSGRLDLGELKHQLDLIEREVWLNNFSNTEARIEVLKKHMADFYDHLVFPSQSIHDYWKDFVDTKLPMTIIPHGVTIAKQKVHRQDQTALNCIYVGGPHYRKGWPILEKAFSAIYEQGNDNIHLRVYGFSPEFVSPLRAYPKVEFHGVFLPRHAAEVFSWADVGIVPSHFETFCLAVREMMLCGVVPIASRAFGIPEVVLDGETGYLIDATEPNQIVDRITFLSDNKDRLEVLRRNLGSVQINKPIDEFASLLAIYEKMVK